MIELSFVLALLGTVLAIAFGALISFQNAFMRSAARSSAIDQAHLGVEQLENNVRSANYIYNPSSYAPYTSYSPGGTATSGVDTHTEGYSLVIYGQTDGNWMCQQWIVSGTNLETRSWTQTYPDDGTTPSSWRVVATDIDNSAQSVVPFSMPSASSYGSRLVDIDLYVKPDAGSGGSSSYGSDNQVQDAVAGRDVEYGYPSNSCSNIPAG